MKRVTAIDERIGLLEAPPGVEDLRADLGEVRDALKEAIESAREMSAREMRDTVASNVSSARNAIEENVGRAIAKLQRLAWAAVFVATVAAAGSGWIAFFLSRLH